MFTLKSMNMGSKKSDRVIVWNKFNQCCAYCGTKLEYNQMQVDHLNPIYRNDSDERLAKMNIVRGTNELKNLFPSCARCNRWKSTYTLEKFRSEIHAQTDRLMRDSAGFKMAMDFKLLKQYYQIPIFYFEYCRTSD